jgi:hypothetical protein
MKVTVLIYKHRHGEDVTVYATPADAHRGGAAIVAEYLHEIPQLTERQEIGRLLAAEKFEDAIEAWHDAQGGDFERIEISEDVLVIGGDL